MIFFPGLHQPSDASKLPRAFISVVRLRRRVKPLGIAAWIMDSGAFSTILLHGGYPEGPEVYAGEIRRWASPALLAAVSQDYMCEPLMLKKTGKTIEQHQTLTIERYDRLCEEDLAGVYLMPVLQGYEPETYVEHLEQYQGRLENEAWVGVGSVCKRNSDPESVLKVLRAIKTARPDLRLHGFGLKITALWDARICGLLYSADSMAWSFQARKEGRNPNSWREANTFRIYVEEIVKA